MLGFRQYLRQNRESISLVKSLLVDNAKQRSDHLYCNYKKLQRHPEIPIFRDRLGEVRNFYDISLVKLIKYFLVYGAPNSRYFKGKLADQFEGQTSPEHLKSAYDKAALIYSLRLMLCYHRYSDIGPFIEHMGLCRKNTPLEVLDYGCGVADFGLILAHLGCRVTIADLDDKKLDFGQWRFAQRGLKPKVIRIASTEEYPNLANHEYDVIIASELLEHVRDPLQLLRNFTQALKIGGYMYETMGTSYPFDQARGDHLEKAKNIIESNQYCDYYKNHYKSMCEQNPQHKNLYQRVI